MATETEAALLRVRHENALQKETIATQHAILAKMWQVAVAADPSVAPQALDQMRAMTRQAEKSRSEADAAHALAGTTRADFAPYVRGVYASTLESMAQEWVKATDAEEHPTAYGEGLVKPSVYKAAVDLCTEHLEQIAAGTLPEITLQQVDAVAIARARAPKAK